MRTMFWETYKADDCTDSDRLPCMHAQHAAKYVACCFCCALCTKRASLATEQAVCGGSSSLSVRLAPSGVWRLSGAANPVIGPQGSPEHDQLGSVENCMLPDGVFAARCEA
jgi:hypothetical protein